MRCYRCKHANPEDGRRYCDRCQAYLAVRPGAYHGDLLQLSREQFLNTASEGLRLIYDNATALWCEAHEIGALGNRRAVGILQLFAEEEAAKSLLLFDAVRCPRRLTREFGRLVVEFSDHLAKGIYVKYYGSRVRDLLEARSIVELHRREVYREGDYGEFIAPNSILYMREKRLYVSYVRDDDNHHGWHSPYPPDFLFGAVEPSAIICLMKALQSLAARGATLFFCVAEFISEIAMIPRPSES